MPDPQLTEKQLQALLRLKRHEQPPPGYFDDLLQSVHQRQREELLRRPAWRIFFERIGAFFASLRKDWSYVGSMAGILMIGIGAIQIALPKRQPVVRVTDPRSTQPAAAGSPGGRAMPIPLEMVQSPQDKTSNPNLRAVKAPRPTRFVIEAQPTSYEPRQIRF